MLVYRTSIVNANHSCPRKYKQKCMTILGHEINIEKKNVNFNPKKYRGFRLSDKCHR